MHSTSTWARVACVAAAVGGVALAPALARADSPPMPPCPPGWNQVGAYTCVKPFECPEGWQLAAGPKCVPWVCKADKDCSWKGTQPCVDARVCEDASGAAVRVCEGDKCPDGLTCKASKLCANGRGLGDTPKFGNWSGPPAGSTSAARPQASATSTGTPSRPAPSGSSGAPTSAAPAKKGGCAAQGGASSPAGALALLGAAGLALVARRRR